MTMVAMLHIVQYFSLLCDKICDIYCPLNMHKYACQPQIKNK